MPLPIIVGFILPDSTLINCSGIGHNKGAMRFINSNPVLFEKFKNSTESDDVEFLMKNCGAVKVCAYLGIRYICIPYLHNEFISRLKDLYASNGYKVCYFSSVYCDNISEESMKEIHLDISPKIYTPQVISEVDPNGNRVYFYNPNRIGD